MKRIHIVIIFGLVVSFLLSCKKLVEVDIPDDRITKEVVFSNDGVASSALSGLYAQMIRSSSQLTSGGATLFLGLSADEMYNSVQSPTTDEFTNNELTPGNTTVRLNFWAHAYNIIYQANSLIEGLQQSTGVSGGVKTQLMGEAKFIRAFVYFYLVNIYGEVPLVVTTNYQQNSIVPRTAVQQIYSQMNEDLTEAKSLLTDTYPSASRTRINKRCASALLARIYLYEKQWDKAEQESSSVINSGLYTLATNLNNVFIASSNETIWQLMPVSTTANTWDGNLFIPASSAIPAYPVTIALANAFSAADQRKAAWIKAVTISGNPYYHPFKYKVKTSTTLSEYYVVFRLAEQYLIRAEARAQQNKIVAAQSDINLIRMRASLPNTSASDQSSLLTAIEAERRLELCFEWGHRWFDLKRTGRIDAVLSGKPSWQPTDALYPIPLMEIQRNPALTQNPGY